MALKFINAPRPQAAETGSLRRRRLSVHRITEKVDINGLLGLDAHAKSNQLMKARRFFLDRIWMMLEDPELTDFKKLAALATLRSKVANRLEIDTDQIAPGPDYQPPAAHIEKTVFPWRGPILTPEARQVQRSRPRDPASRHSEPQVILYRKLKQLCAEDVELCKRHESKKAAEQQERKELQATAAILNDQLADLDLYDDLLSPGSCLGDVVSEELAARAGRPKRLPRKKLQLPQTQGMLRLLKDKHDRYHEERILPWDTPPKDEPWWRRSRPSLGQRRSSCDSSTSGDTVLSISTSSSVEFQPAASSPSIAHPRRSRRFVSSAKKLKSELWSRGSLEAISEE